MNVIIDGVSYAPMIVSETDKTLIAALNLRFDQDGFEQITIRDYLCKLLLALWEKREFFNSTYPLGNSGWDYGIYVTLIQNGFIKGGVSATRGIIMSKKQSDIASDYVRQLIKAVFYGVENNETH